MAEKMYRNMKQAEKSALKDLSKVMKVTKK